MVKRILIVILIVLSLSLLLSIESDATGDGETSSEESDSDCKIEFAYDMDKIEVRVGDVLLSEKIKCITGTRLELQQTIITATSKIIGYDAYRTYAGKDWSCSSSFVPQNSEINSTITFFIDFGIYEFTFDGGNKKSCKFNETVTMPNKDSTTNGYVINTWEYNNSKYSVGQELCVDTSFLETNNIYKNQKLKFKSILTPIDYKATYNLNGGLATYANEEMVINLETPITMPDIPPVKDDFSFKCWKIGDVCLQCGDTYNLVYSIIDGNGMVTITALWTTTVLEDLAHCTLIATNKCADYGETWSGTLKPDAHYTMPSYILSDYVYTLNSDGTASIKINSVTAPINIVASAIPIEHSVTLNPDGGNLDIGIIIVNEVIEKELPTPTKEGCVFNGWYNDTTLITNTKDITSDCTLKASWRATTNPSSSGGSSSTSSEGSGSSSSSSSGSGTSGTSSGGSSGGSSSSGTSSGSGSGSSTTPSGGGSSSTPSSGGSVTPTPVTDPETEDTEITDETEDTTEKKEPETKVYEHRFYIDDTGRVWRIGDPSGISETPTRDGYTFGGWYILIDGERIPYTEGLNIDTNVYAIWNIVKTDGDGNPMIPAAAIASVLAVVLIVLVTGRKIN